jgi:hypothetical protein
MTGIMWLELEADQCTSATIALHCTSLNHADDNENGGRLWALPAGSDRRQQHELSTLPRRMGTSNIDSCGRLNLPGYNGFALKQTFVAFQSVGWASIRQNELASV